MTINFKNSLFTILLNSILFSVLFFLSSCRELKFKVSIPEIEDLANKFEEQSEKWQGESGTWRQLIEETIDRLGEDSKDIISRLEQIIKETERAAFNLSSCSTEYLTEFAGFQIELLLEELTGKTNNSTYYRDSNFPVTEKSILCHISISNGEINLDNEKIESQIRFSAFGYIGENEQLIAKIKIGEEVKEISNAITRTSNNEIRIDLSQTYYSGLLEKADVIIIHALGYRKDLSVLKVI